VSAHLEHWHCQRGVTLIELMIATALTSFLLLGLIQVFSASRLAYQSTTGLARVQEGSRFSTEILQRDIRMAGHMGCANDRARSSRQPGAFLDTLFLNDTDRDAGLYGNALFPLRFDVPIQGFEADGTAPGGVVNVSTPGGGWLPALDPALLGAAGLSPAPRAGSDVLVLRMFSGDSAPLIVSIQPATAQPAQIFVGPIVAGVPGVSIPGYYGIASCERAAVLQNNRAVPGNILVTAAANNLTANFSTSVGGAGPPISEFIANTTQVFRADSFVYYVGVRGGGTVPSLYRARFFDGAWGASEELVEGVESMQLLYGRDANRDGAVEDYVTANQVAPAGAPHADLANSWRAVASVQLGLVLRSPEPAGTPDRNVGANGATLVLGVTVNANTNEGILRRPYETTIALRNRLFGN